MRTDRYHPLVAVDLRDACRHYDAIAGTLGDRFRTNVQLKIQAVVERPESCGYVGGDFRGALVDRLPYVVVFTVDDGTINIYGVRHASTDRQTWFERTMPGVSG
jgi:hypothetical protein